MTIRPNLRFALVAESTAASEVQCTTGAARYVGATLEAMPTTLPRHTITETADVKAWLDEASLIWPDEASTRASLLKRLLEAGHQATADQFADITQNRRNAIEDASGTLTGLWPAGWYEQYKQDEWPA